MKINCEISTGNIISVAIPVLTFFWYRSGRLWSLYFAIYDKSLVQFKEQTLGKQKWEEIFENEIKALSQNIFGAVFSFENAYLRYLMAIFWENNLYTIKNLSGTNSVKLNDGKIFEESHEFEITDDELYVRNQFRAVFGRKFLFGGALLFAYSVIWLLRNLYIKDGYSYFRKYKIYNSGNDNANAPEMNPLNRDVQ